MNFQHNPDDPLIGSKDDSDEFIYCTLCDDFKAPKERKDNFERHMKTHYGTKVTCACGKEMAPTSLSRHRQKSCPMKKQQQEQQQQQQQQEKIECECGAILNKTSLRRHKNTSCLLKNQLSSTGQKLDQPAIESVHTSNVLVRFVTYKDGKTALFHDEIKFGNQSFILTPLERVEKNESIENTPLTPTSLTDEDPDSIKDNAQFNYDDNDSVLIADPNLNSLHDDMFDLHEEIIGLPEGPDLLHE